MNILLAVVIGVIGIALFILLWDKPAILIALQLIISCTSGLFYTQMGLPTTINYIMDAINAYLLFLSMFVLRKNMGFLGALWPCICIALLFMITMISYIVNKQPLYLYLWGFRCIFRFFIFFVSCITFLHKKDILNIIKLSGVLFAFNFVLCIFQFYVQGYRVDVLGGMYGTIMGCNGGLNIFLTQMCIFAVVAYLYKKVSFLKMDLFLGISLYIAALSELKAVFLEIIIIVLLAILLSKPSRKTLFTISIVGIGSVTAYALLIQLYPHFEDFLSMDSLMDYTVNKSYGTEHGVNRLTGFAIIYAKFFDTNLLRLFGIGMGNADFSSFFQSEFYMRYKSLNYSWFYGTWLYLENGILGLVAMIGFYISIVIKSLKIKKIVREDKYLVLISIISAVMALMHIVYNGALRMDYAYFYMFWLSIAFVIWKDWKLENQEVIKEVTINPLQGNFNVINPVI